MDELFIAAMESLLDLYGSSGILEMGSGARIAVRTSPIFPAELAGPSKKAGAQYLLFDSSVLIQVPENMTEEIVPLNTTLLCGSVRYTICTVSAVPGNAYELGIKL